MAENNPPNGDDPSKSDARPRGTPLGRAFIIPSVPIYEELMAVVRIASSVHGDGPLPTIPMRLESLPSQVQARFWYDPNGPISIVVNSLLPHRGFAAVHEIGHFLDFSGIDVLARFSSEASDEFAPWRTAVVRSRRVRELQESVEAIVGTVPSDVASIYRTYLEIPEIWARSYAQYVTVRSRDPRLLAGLATHRLTAEADEATIERLLHWDDEDFAPIAAAIEAMFRRLGWRSEH